MLLSKAARHDQCPRSAWAGICIGFVRHVFFTLPQGIGAILSMWLERGDSVPPARPGLPAGPHAAVHLFHPTQ